MDPSPGASWLQHHVPVASLGTERACSRIVERRTQGCVWRGMGVIFKLSALCEARLLAVLVCLFPLARAVREEQARHRVDSAAHNTGNDQLIVFFNEDAQDDLLVICGQDKHGATTPQLSWIAGQSNMTYLLPSGTCRHVYTGIVTGAAGAFTNDHLELLQACMPGGIQSWHLDARIHTPELVVNPTQNGPRGMSLFRASPAAASSHTLNASAGSQQQDPYTNNPFLPPRLDDQRQMGMGLQLDRSSGLQQVPGSNMLWGLDRIDQLALPLNQKYQWGLSSTNMGQGVTIYLLDTGIRASHQEFTQGGSWQSSRATHGAQFGVLEDGATAGSDCDGHGTLVASVAGGWATGVAKLASLVSVQVLDCNATGPSSDTLAGLEWVAENAEPPAVVIMSLGSDSEFAAPMEQAVRRLVQDFNLTVVSAAGNSRKDACNTSPANVDVVITVGASEVENKFSPDQEQQDILYTWSNTGNCTDLFAPGVNIYGACGGQGRCPDVNDTAYTWDTGTSFAAPFVAGAAAVYLSDHPLALPSEVKAALMSAATQGQMDLSDALPGTPNAFLSSLLFGPPVAAASGPDQATAESASDWVSIACEAGSGINGPGRVACDQGQAAGPSQAMVKPSVPSG
ncbi:hypothetical protein WJX74_000008 [Apatococcus lobatus]|uniref:Peptidase S8/S53 domain-containing protein n=1 Tax=Apatococcus lobatus TaxID=904363 RepID=A0AAW1RZ77_9CHLO